MLLFISDNDDEFAKIKLTLGRSVKHFRDRRELIDTLTRDSQSIANVVIIGANMDLGSALSLAEELRLSHPTVGVLLLRKKVETAVLSQAMGAGIRDVLSLNEPEAIVVACKRSEEISRRQSLIVSNGNTANHTGTITVIHGPRDGLGATTIATNLALALSATPDAKICLVDALPTYGDIAVRLRINTTKSWADLIELALVDDEALHATLVTVKDGPSVLVAPRDEPSVEFDGSAFVTQVLRPLQERFSNLIIDTDSRSNLFTREILRIADRVVLCTDLDLASLKNLKLRLKELASLGLDENQFLLIVNKSDLQVGVNLKDIPELIGLSIAASLPWDPDVTRLANEGNAIAVDRPRSSLSHSIQHIIEALQTTVSTAAKSKSRTRRSA